MFVVSYLLSTWDIFLILEKSVEMVQWLENDRQDAARLTFLMD